MKRFGLVIIMLVVFGCGFSSDKDICQKGETMSCSCPNLTVGVQRCLDSEDGWDECKCYLCGDGVCSDWETSATCCQDCGCDGDKICQQGICVSGNSVCFGYEGNNNCCQDDDPCGLSENNICECENFCSWDSVDCFAEGICGDGICNNQTESYFTCCQDCGCWDASLVCIENTCLEGSTDGDVVEIDYQMFCNNENECVCFDDEVYCCQNGQYVFQESCPAEQLCIQGKCEEKICDSDQLVCLNNIVNICIDNQFIFQEDCGNYANCINGQCEPKPLCPVGQECTSGILDEYSVCAVDGQISINSKLCTSSHDCGVNEFCVSLDDSVFFCLKLCGICPVGLNCKNFGDYNFCINQNNEVPYTNNRDCNQTFNCDYNQLCIFEGIDDRYVCSDICSLLD